MLTCLTKLWALIRDPYTYIPDHQQLDRWQHQGHIIPLRPTNRPLWPTKPFHNEPLIQALRIYRTMGKDRIWWKDLLTTYEQIKREKYG